MNIFILIGTLCLSTQLFASAKDSDLHITAYSPLCIEWFALGDNVSDEGVLKANEILSYYSCLLDEYSYASRKGETLLYKSITSRNLKMVNALLHRGANIRCGWIPISTVEERGGIAWTSGSPLGKSCMQQAVDMCLQNHSDQRCLDIVKSILEYHPDALRMVSLSFNMSFTASSSIIINFLKNFESYLTECDLVEKLIISAVYYEKSDFLNDPFIKELLLKTPVANKCCVAVCSLSDEVFSLEDKKNVCRCVDSFSLHTDYDSNRYPTLLMKACEWNDIALYEMIVEKGGGVDISNTDFESVYSYALAYAEGPFLERVLSDCSRLDFLWQDERYGVLALKKLLSSKWYDSLRKSECEKLLRQEWVNIKKNYDHIGNSKELSDACKVQKDIILDVARVSNSHIATHVLAQSLSHKAFSMELLNVFPPHFWLERTEYHLGKFLADAIALHAPFGYLRHLCDLGVGTNGVVTVLTDALYTRVARRDFREEEDWFQFILYILDNKNASLFCTEGGQHSFFLPACVFFTPTNFNTLLEHAKPLLHSTFWYKEVEFIIQIFIQARGLFHSSPDTFNEQVNMFNNFLYIIKDRLTYDQLLTLGRLKKEGDFHATVVFETIDRIKNSKAPVRYIAPDPIYRTPLAAQQSLVGPALRRVAVYSVPSPAPVTQPAPSQAPAPDPIYRTPLAAQQSLVGPALRRVAVYSVPSQAPVAQPVPSPAPVTQPVPSPAPVTQPAPYQAPAAEAAPVLTEELVASPANPSELADHSPPALAPSPAPVTQPAPYQAPAAEAAPVWTEVPVQAELKQKWSMHAKKIAGGGTVLALGSLAYLAAELSKNRENRALVSWFFKKLRGKKVAPLTPQQRRSAGRLKIDAAVAIPCAALGVAAVVAARRMRTRVGVE